MATADSILSEAQRQRRRKRLFVVTVIVVTLAYILVVGASFIVVRSPLFHIRDISIYGNNVLSEEDILDFLRVKVMDKISWKHLLGFKNILVWPATFSRDDMKLLPLLKSIQIEKNYQRRSIAVHVSERVPYGIWCFLTGAQSGAEETRIPADGKNTTNVSPTTDERLSATSECWWFDTDGVIFKRAVAAQGNLLRAVDDYSQNGLRLYSSVLPQAFVPNLFSIFRVIEGSGLSVREIRLNDLTLEELEVDTYNGPKLYFSLRFPADNALAVIESLIGKPDFQKLQYVDFRVENRAYYK